MDLVHTNKKLRRAYRSAFKKTVPAFFDKNGGIEYFVTYLSFLRDSIIVSRGTPVKEATSADLAVISLVTAIAEYHAYKRSVEKLKQTPDSMADLGEKQLHWSSFWFLVSKNIERWLELYDTV